MLLFIALLIEDNKGSEMRFAIIVVFCSSLCMLCKGLHTAGKDRPLVRTNSGVFKGLYKISTFKGKRYNLNRFLGIRYAKEPTGELRFMKPEPYAYEEPLEATEYGSACPQVDLMGLGVESADEDCLFLNLFIPTECSDKASGHAVIIFIQGGGFTYGSSSLTPGDIMAAVGNVIVVTFNYRLGIFGFLNPGNDTFPANVGLWDQRLVIQWVKDNIKSFGGDPERITLLGESSGALSAVLHGMYPKNEGLFQNIIAISGTPFMPPGMLQNNSLSAQYLADMVICYPTGHYFKTCMQDQNITLFMDALKIATNNMHVWRRLHFFPTVDGEYITANPLSILLHAKSEHVEAVEFLRSIRLIAGVNGGEGGLWVVNMADDLDNLKITSAEMAAEFIPHALPHVVGFGTDIPELLEKIVLAEYTDWNNLTDARHQYIKFMGDLNFNVPMTELGMVHANSDDPKTWMFKFDAQLTQHILPTANWMKEANHGDILAPLFGFYDEFVFGLYRSLTDYKPEQFEERLSRRLLTYFTTFAKTGDPNLDQTNMTVKYTTLSLWPHYNATTQHYLSFRNKRDYLGEYLFARELNFWRNIVPEVMDTVAKLDGPAVNVVYEGRRKPQENPDKSSTLQQSDKAMAYGASADSPEMPKADGQLPEGNEEEDVEEILADDDADTVPSHTEL